MTRTPQYPLVQLSPRGQLTLPAEVCRALGLQAGDAFTVRIQDGEIVLGAVEVTPVELYSDARLREFEQNADMTEAELAQARAVWGL